MATSGGLVDKQGLIDAQVDVTHLGNVANSTDATSVSREGVTHKTLSGLQDEYETAIAQFEANADVAIANAGYQDAGDYENDDPINSPNDYLVYQRATAPTQWKTVSGASLPYTPDSTATPDPEDDPNLELIRERNVVTSIAELQARSTSTDAAIYLSDADFSGWFEWRTGDFTTEIALDTVNGVYASSDSDPTGSTGAWVRVVRENSYDPLWFGAVPIDVDNPSDRTDSYAALQTAELIAELTSGTVLCGHMFSSGYGIFVGSGVSVTAKNPLKHGVLFVNPTPGKGRGGFILGSSREWDRTTGLSEGFAGTYGSMTNESVTDLPLGTFLRDNLGQVAVSEASVHDIRIEAEYSASSAGGYAINMVNALNCNAYNIYGSGWTELVNMGSDVDPSTPSCHECHAWNLIVPSPSQYSCFYAIGFIANSTSCSIRGAKVYTDADNDTTNNNVAAMRVCEDTHMYDIIAHDWGSNGNAAGPEINDCLRSSIQKVEMWGGNFTVVSVNQSNTLTHTEDDKNIIKGVVGHGAGTALARMAAPYDEFLDITDNNCAATYSIQSGSEDNKAQLKRGHSVVTALNSGDVGATIFSNNISFGSNRTVVIQPGEFGLVSASLSSIVEAQISADSAEVFKDLDGLICLEQVILNGVFGGGSASNSATFDLDVLSYDDFVNSGDINSNFTVLESVQKTPTNDTEQNFQAQVVVRDSIFDIDSEKFAIRGYFNNAVLSGTRVRSLKVVGWFFE